MLSSPECLRVKQDQSVIIPSYCAPDQCFEVLTGLLRQSRLPIEVILVRVGTLPGGEDGCWSPWIEDFARNGVELKVAEVKSILFPGAARNVGLQYASNPWIAFVDVETIPNERWLEEQVRLIEATSSVGSFGLTTYVATSFKEAVVRDAIFGRRPKKTLPGSVLRKDVFNFVGYFIPNIRAAEDTEWMIRAKTMGVKMADSSHEAMSHHMVSYIGLTRVGIGWLTKKWRRNYLSSRQLQHVKVQATIVWLFAYVVVSLIAFNWNEIVAGWQRDSPFYIDHITKIVSLTPLVLYIVLRGCYLPFKRGVPLLEIFPFRFVLLASVCALLDAVKVATIFFPRKSRLSDLKG